MARYQNVALRTISEDALTEALARTPLDHFVIWNGISYASQRGSILDRVSKLVERAWEPVQLRALLTAAAKLTDNEGLCPDRVRAAIRMHQVSGNTCYFLARRNVAGDFVAATEIPRPASRRALAEGDPIPLQA